MTFTRSDLSFILVSTPSSPFSAHGHRLLIIAPIIEGILGGWSTLQSATHAYLSDCTSSGSRAHIFSRFAGVFYIGSSVGPSVGGYLIKHPLFASTKTSNGSSVTSVFWVAIICSFINFLLVLFVFPESLYKAKRLRAIAEKQGKGKARAPDNGITETSPMIDQAHQNSEGVIRTFLKPLSMFLPVVVYDGGKRRSDWSLTFLGGALLLSMIATVGDHVLEVISHLIFIFLICRESTKSNIYTQYMLMDGELSGSAIIYRSCVARGQPFCWSFALVCHGFYNLNMLLSDIDIQGLSRFLSRSHSLPTLVPLLMRKD